MTLKIETHSANDCLGTKEICTSGIMDATDFSTALEIDCVEHESPHEQLNVPLGYEVQDEFPAIPAGKGVHEMVVAPPVE